MKKGFYLSITLLLGAAAVSMADDVLDAKLAALKKKVRRGSYSTAAILNDQNLNVPQAATEEEKALDDKLRKMSKELDSQPSMLSQQMAPPRAIARPAQEKPVNWLTPAMLGETAAESRSTATGDDAWIQAELTRQKDIQLEKLSMEEERLLVDQRLRDEGPGGMTAPRSSLNSYSESLQDILSGGAAAQPSRRSLRSAYSTDETPGQALPGSTVRNSARRPYSSFTPTQTPDASSTRRAASSASQRAPLHQSFDHSPSSPTGQNPLWETPELPQKRLRRPAPAHQTNPFEQNLMPSMKQSIWD